MKINGTSNNSLQNKVLLDTFIDQISALQTDVGNLQIADNNLANDIATKASTADIANAVSTNTLNAQNGNIKKLKVQGTGSSATIENATIGTASIGTENVTQSNITNLEVMDVDAGTVRAGTLTVENDATVSGDLSVQDISAKDITSASVNTLNLTAAESTVTALQSDTAEVTDKLTVKDLEVNGDFTGVSSIDTEDIDTDNIKAKTAEVTETLKAQNTRDWLSQVMNRTQILPTPSPQLEPADRYTIELPRFNGVYLLSWENGNTVVWTATVIGNGKSYGISWGSRTEENFITDLFQYNGKLYIRINSNGALKCAYSATEELPNPTIYFNMVGWTQDKSLEELCDERSHIINEYFTGTAWFGNTFITRLENAVGGINFRGLCTFNELPNLQNSQVGDVWNITDDAYTDDNFVEGAGQPINAGDDVVAVEADMPVEYIDVDGANWTKYQGIRSITFVSSTGRLFDFGYSTRSYSDDNGATWVNADFGDITNVGYNYDMFETSTGTLLFSSRNGNYRYIFRSTDNGTTWTATEFSDAYTKITFFEDSHHRIWISPYIYYVAGGTVSPNVRVSTDDGETFNVPNGLHATGQFEFFETDAGRLFITGLYRHFVSGGTRDTFGMFYTDDFVNYTRCKFPSGKIPFSSMDNIYSSEGIGVFRLYQFNGRLITSKPILDNTDDFASCLYYSDDNGDTWNEVQCLNNMIIDNSNYDKNFYCTGDVVKVQDKLVTFSTNQMRDPQTSQFYWEIRFAYSLNNGASWIAYSYNYTRFDTQITKLFVLSDDKRLMILGSNVKYSDDAGKTINSTDFNTTYGSGSNYFDMYEKDKVLYFGEGYSVPNTRYDKVHKRVWDKFAAGVDYGNFVAANITASTALKSEGTLEVDGTSQFDSNVTVTGNITQTGNLNITGNETVSGSSTLNNVTANTVIIGDLD